MPCIAWSPELYSSPCRMTGGFLLFKLYPLLFERLLNGYTSQGGYSTVTQAGPVTQGPFTAINVPGIFEEPCLGSGVDTTHIIRMTSNRYKSGHLPLLLCYVLSLESGEAVPEKTIDKSYV